MEIEDQETEMYQLQRRRLLELPEIRLWLTVLLQAKTDLIWSHTQLLSRVDFVQTLPAARPSPRLTKILYGLHEAFALHTTSARFFTDPNSPLEAFVALAKKLDHREDELMRTVRPYLTPPYPKRKLIRAIAAHRRRNAARAAEEEDARKRHLQIIRECLKEESRVGGEDHPVGGGGPAGLPRSREAGADQVRRAEETGQEASTAAGEGSASSTKAGV